MMRALFDSSLDLMGAGNGSIDSPRDSDGEPRGSGEDQISKLVSKLLICLGQWTGFDPAIPRFESWHPSQ